MNRTMVLILVLLIIIIAFAAIPAILILSSTVGKNKLITNRVDTSWLNKRETSRQYYGHNRGA